MVEPCSQCGKSHPPVSKEARDALLEKNLPLVRRAAKKIHRNLPETVEEEDLVAIGIFGLIRAIEHYDPSSEVHFETYAIASIRGVIADELRSQDWAPRSLRKKQKTVEITTTQLEAELGRSPTAEEISSKSELSPQEVVLTAAAVANSSHARLDDVWNDTDRHASIPDRGPTPDRSADTNYITQALVEFIQTWPQQDQLIIVLYYFEDMKLREIAATLGLQEARVSAIHVKRVTEIRHKLMALIQGT